MTPVVVLLESLDLAHLDAIPCGTDTVEWVVVSPAIEHGLRRKVHGRVNVRRSFRHFSHGKTAVNSIRVMNSLANAFPHLPEYVFHVLRQNCFFLGNLSSRMWYSLGSKGPWWVRTEGSWNEYRVRSDAHRAALMRVIDFDYIEALPARISPKTKGFSLCLGFLGRAKRWIVAPASNLKLGILDALRGPGALRTRIATYAAPEKAPRTRKETVFAFAKVFFDHTRLLAIPWRITGVSDPDFVNALRSAFSALPSRPEYVAIGLARENLIRLMSKMVQAYDPTVMDTRALSPRLMIAHELNTPAAALLGQVCSDVGVPVRIANHNSLVVGKSRIANEMTRALVEQRIAGFSYAEVLSWSPLQARAVRELSACRHDPVPVRVPNVKPVARASKDFRILHAGNYIGWNVSFPWIGETSDEYLAGIESLANLVRDLPGVRLDVRVRPKGECDLSTVSERLGPRANVFVNSTSQSEFGIQLSESDLVVGFMSTTLEEALQARKPVLLWGPTSRYRHLPCQDYEPTPDRRSSVYVLAEGADGRSMIEAIRAAHAGRPLDDDEIAPFVWPSSTPLLAEAIGIAGRDR